MGKPIDRTAKIPVTDAEAEGIKDGIREALTNGEAEKIKDKAMRKRKQDQEGQEDREEIPAGIQGES